MTFLNRMLYYMICMLFYVLVFLLGMLVGELLTAYAR